MKSSHAFDLIKSLSMSEKRNFKIFSSRHVIGEINKSNILFDVLDKIDTYNEVEIASRLKQSKFDLKYLKADQNYLYNLILRSLKQFHESKSANLQVKTALCDIEILFDKGAFRQCFKEITKAKETAWKSELFDLLLNILFWERKLSLFYTEGMKTEVEIVLEMEEVNSKINSYLSYTQLYSYCLVLMRKMVSQRNKTIIAEFEKKLESPLVKNFNSKLPLICQIRYYQIFALWYFIQGDRKNELIQNRKLIRLIDQNVFYKEEYPLDYVNTYSRILSIVKDIEPKEFDTELKNMRGFAPISESIAYKRVQAQIFSNSFTMQLSFLITSKKYKLAYELIDELQNGLKEYSKIVSPSTNVTFRYIIAYLYFANGEFKQAKKAVNFVLNEFEEKIRPEIYNFARILNILIHYELKDYGMIKSLHNSALYYFKKQNNPYKTENLFLNYFGNPKRYKSSIKESLLELKTEFEQIKSDKAESNVFKYFEFIDWIDSKLKGVSMAKLQK
jgi:hypothetical protein